MTARSRSAMRRAMTPTLRKPLGVLSIVAGLVAYALLIAAGAPTIETLPVLVQAILYLLLGTIWVLPLRPVVIWMETGLWRSKKPSK